MKEDPVAFDLSYGSRPFVVTSGDTHRNGSGRTVSPHRRTAECLKRIGRAPREEKRVIRVTFHMKDTI